MEVYGMKLKVKLKKDISPKVPHFFPIYGYESIS